MLVAGSLVILVAGENPIRVYGLVLRETFGDDYIEVWYPGVAYGQREARAVRLIDSV